MNSQLTNPVKIAGSHEKPDTDKKAIEKFAGSGRLSGEHNRTGTSEIAGR
jgi:hypothetical protein